MPSAEKLPRSFTDLLDVMVKYVALRDQVRAGREKVAGELHERGWSAQAISDELKAHLDDEDLDESQLRVLGVSRATIDADIRNWKRDQERQQAVTRKRRPSSN